jgi:tRNA-dihydrouridine synthase 2
MESLPSFSDKVVGKLCLAPMVRMNTLPFREMALTYGADYVFSEEIVDRKFLTCVRVENELLGTIDYVTARDYALVLRLKKGPEEREKFIL